MNRVGRAEVEAMLAVSFQTKPKPPPDTIASVRKAFKDADELFEMQDNDREFEVLCGATLATLLAHRTDAAAFAALATTTTSLAGARKTNVPPDLVTTAEQSIAEISELRRTRPDPDVSSYTNSPKVSFEQSSAAVKQNWASDGAA